MAGLVLNIGANVDPAIAGLKKFESELSRFTTGSISQLRKAAASLKNELSNLTPQQLNAPLGKGLTSSLKIINQELKALETQAAISGNVTSNAFSKAFGGARQLANIIPGLGLSGLFLLAFTGAEKLIAGIFDISKGLTNAQRAAQGFNHAFAEATKSSGAELTKLESLVNIAKDVSQSTERRKNAIQALQKEYPDYLRNINLENINSVAAKKAIDDLTKSIFQKALAEVLATQVAEKQARLIELQIKLGNQLKDFGKTVGTSQEKTFFGQVLKGAAGQTIQEINIIKDEIEKFKEFAQEAIAEGLDFTKTPKPDLKKKIEDAFKESDILIRARLQPIAPLQNDLDEVSKEIQKAFEERAKNLPQLSEKSFAAKEIQRQISINAEIFKNIRDDAQRTAEFVSSALGGAFNSFFDAIKGGENPIKAFFLSVVQAVQQLVVQLIQAAIKSFILKSILGGATGGAGFALGGLHGLPHLAGGGPVRAGSAYVVGEVGKELFVPKESGRIIPNNQLSGIMGQASPQVVYLDARLSMREIVLGVARELRYQNR